MINKYNYLLVQLFNHYGGIILLIEMHIIMNKENLYLDMIF